MKHFCLAIPDGMHEKTKAACDQRAETITAYIRNALAAKLQMDYTGQRFCADGNPCILALMPSYQNLASTSKSLLDQKSVLPGLQITRG